MRGTADQGTPRRQAERERRSGEGLPTLRACAAVLAAAVLFHVGMLVESPHQAAAVTSPVVVAGAGADHQGEDSEPAHAMVVTCLAVLSLLAAAGAVAHGRHSGGAGRDHQVRVPQAGVRERSTPTSCARGPTRVDAGVVLRV